MGEEAFFEAERAHTYLGKGFWKRAAMLVAGVAVNIVSGFLLLMCIYSIVGVSVAQDVNQVGSVVEGSVAASVGLEPGDEIVSVAGTATDSWTAVVNALGAAADEGPVELVYRRDGADATVTIDLSQTGELGITIPTTVVHLNPLAAARLSFEYVAATASSIAQLVNPSHTMEVLDNSTSIVGISAMAAEAAAVGPSTYLSLAALISFSLGLMNLLPIPPLDGGKLLIEIIQAVLRRPVPLKVQTGLSYVGIALFAALFIYVLRGDILRFIL